MPSFAIFEEALQYIGWTQADTQALRELAPVVEPHTQAIAEEFYERIRMFPRAEAVLRDEAQVRRLQQSLRVWLMESLNGPHDEAFFERRCRIGYVHVRIGLAQRFMISALTVVRMHLLKIVLEKYSLLPDKLVTVERALCKVMDLELLIINEAYLDAYFERILNTERQSQRGMEQRLAAAEARYRDAIEYADALFMVLDHNMQPILWNQKASEVTGYAYDEVCNRKPLEMMMVSETVLTDLRSIETGRSATIESTLTTRAGRERFVRWFASRVVDKEHFEPLMYLIAVDLTDMREAEMRARSAERLAAVGTLAAGLAHEIRNPLNAASLHLMVLDRALKKIPNVPENAAESVHVLRDEIHRLGTLVTEFLDFARPRPLSLTDTELKQLLQSTSEFLFPDIQMAKIAFEKDFPVRPIVVPVDAEKLRQVLINLFRNAMEALNNQEEKKIVVRLRSVGTAVEIDVEDNGPGVPNNQQIFDAFYTTKETGTGLGLAIVHRIMDAHRGAIFVDSVPGKTTFTLRIPTSSMQTT
jgi:PAS domain S-box-containing protein